MTPDGGYRATVILRARGPVDRDLPAYTLQGYCLEWTVAAPEDQRVFAHGVIALPTLAPGTAWSGTIEWTAPQADSQLSLRLLRPTEFSVLEHTFEALGGRR
jgi:hypothetical protein